MPTAHLSAPLGAVVPFAVGPDGFDALIVPPLPPVGSATRVPPLPPDGSCVTRALGLPPPPPIVSPNASSSKAWRAGQQTAHDAWQGVTTKGLADGLADSLADGPMAFQSGACAVSVWAATSCSGQTDRQPATAPASKLSNAFPMLVGACRTAAGAGAGTAGGDRR